MPVIAVFGSEGHMGKLVCLEAGDACIAGYDIKGPGLNLDVELPAEVDVIIDFSLPGAWRELDRLLEGSKTALVSGTTGLGAEEAKLIDKWSKERAVFYSANMSRGIFVLGRLLADSAEMLGEDFDMELVEIHHSRKVDSPSGTALTLSKIWKNRCGGDEKYGRQGAAGPRARGEIGIHSVRGGDVVGEHNIYLLGDGERLLLSHIATGRNTFAIGAVKAAEWLVGKPAGLYSMEDMMAGKITE